MTDAKDEAYLAARVSACSTMHVALAEQWACITDDASPRRVAAILDALDAVTLRKLITTARGCPECGTRGDHYCPADVAVD